MVQPKDGEQILWLNSEPFLLKLVSFPQINIRDERKPCIHARDLSSVVYGGPLLIKSVTLLVSDLNIRASITDNCGHPCFIAPSFIVKPGLGRS